MKRSYFNGIISLSIVVIMGLAAPALAAPYVGAVGEALHPSTNRTIPVNQNMLPHDGQVSETFNASGYTYLQVVKDGKKTWLAIPLREIPVGAKIRYGNGSAMKSFHSSTLNRTFDEIFFLDRVEVAGESSAPKGKDHPPIPDRQPSQAKQSNNGQVSEVLAAGAYSYLHVVNEGKNAWLAIPFREIPVGAKIRYGEGMLMKSFHSSTLNRTFDEVYFLDGVTVAGE